jgi:hypothetical protein
VVQIEIKLRITLTSLDLVDARLTGGSRDVAIVAMVGAPCRYSGDPTNGRRPATQRDLRRLLFMIGYPGRRLACADDRADERDIRDAGTLSPMTKRIRL